MRRVADADGPGPRHHPPGAHRSRGRAPPRPTARPGRTGRGAPAVPVSAPCAAGGSPAGRPASARRVRLTVSRVDPWSAMKVSFLLSVALGIALVVMTVVLWTVLDAMGVFDQVNGVIGEVIQDDGTQFDILDFVGFTRVVSLSIVFGVVDVILFTAISTLAAFLYNVSPASSAACTSPSPTTDRARPSSRRPARFGAVAERWGNLVPRAPSTGAQPVGERAYSSDG